MPQTHDFSAQGEVLVVDDDADIRELLIEHLRGRGFRVASAADGRAAIAAVERSPGHFSLILTDLQLPGADGLAVLRAAKQLNPGVHVVIITGYASLDSAIEAVRSGAYDYLTKPFSLGQLDVVLARIRDRQALEQENRQLAKQVGSREPVMGATFTAKLDALEVRLDRIEHMLKEIAGPRRRHTD
jgi:two-component system, NtrC family, response regulator AtoC